jgi:hypothetical protein
MVMSGWAASRGDGGLKGGREGGREEVGDISIRRERAGAGEYGGGYMEVGDISIGEGGDFV